MDLDNEVLDICWSETMICRKTKNFELPSKCTDLFYFEDGLPRNFQIHKVPKFYCEYQQTFAYFCHEWR